MNDNDPIKQTTGNVAKTADSAIGKKIALAANAPAPIVGPIIVDFLWKHKYKILMLLLGVLCFFCFAFISIFYSITAQTKGYFENIPSDQKDCIDKANTKYGVESQLLIAFDAAIAKFDPNHKGQGSGFLEIPNDDWNNFGVDIMDRKTTDSGVLCNNFFTLANKLKSLSGSSEQKIDAYGTSYKDQIKQMYELYQGTSLIPYGNPIGLNQSDLAVVTSGYNVSRDISGITNVHTGVDFVPSSKWYSENPGLGTTDAINKAIVSGIASTFQDSYGALCVYITNPAYRVLYCHCRQFIVQNGAQVNYGDPICILGNTGFSTGPHVHVEVHKKSSNGSWERLDPTPFIEPQQ